jgi:hypothetical protein
MTEQELQQKINEIVEKKLENYFRQHINGVEITMNAPTVGHGIGEYCLTTDTNQGIQIYKQGNMKLSANRSIEIRSHTKPKNTDASITIASECGNLVIEAKNGDVVLKGKNVQIEATDKDGIVFIKSAKTIRTEAPRVDIEGTNVSILADLNLSAVGANTTIYGGISMEMTEGHEAILNGSLLSKIINGLDEIKKFFKSPCGG